MGKKTQTAQTVLEALDSPTREAILNLNEKMRRLQVEITAKLDTLSEQDPASFDAKNKQLQTLADEVQQTLDGIHAVIHTLIPEHLSPQAFLDNHRQELDAFREMIINNTEKIDDLFDNL